MKQNSKKIIFLLAIILLLTTGCTKTLKDSNKKVVTNPETGQSLTENILCRPTNKEIIKIYKDNGIDINSLPKCSDFTPATGGYEGLWNSIFVKPLAFVILWFNNYVKNAAVALIITSLIIRLIAYPLTKKTAMQSELLKKAQPELKRLEKKYEGKTDQESIMKKSQEMTMIYRKYNINPVSGCVYALIQLPLFIAFLEAINRVPALFEGKFLGLQLGTTPSVGLLTNHNFLYLILIAIVGATTYYSFSMNKTTSQDAEDPMKNMTTIMTVMIVVMGFFMSSALCIYWVTTNLFTVAQNLIVKRSKENVSKK